MTTKKKTMMSLNDAMEFGPEACDVLRAEVEQLRAILEGRTTPPTDAEFDAHVAGGGRWYVADHARGGEVRSYPLTVREMARWHRERNASWRWYALDADGRPCAWPTVTPLPTPRRLRARL